MDATFWHKQSDKPLFPEIEWNKPERRDQAGKLLIIGGNKQGFASVAAAYGEAMNNGAGEIKLILPDSLRNLPIIQTIPECILAKSNAAGALGQDAWPQLQASLAWSDWVLLPGDLSHNPETVQLLQRLMATQVPLTFTDDSLSLIIQDARAILDRPNTLVCCSFRNLQKIVTSIGYGQALTSTMGLAKLVDILHDLTSENSACLSTNFNDMHIVAQAGQISTTKANNNSVVSPTKATVYAMQNPSNIFAAVTQTSFENN